MNKVTTKIELECLKLALSHMYEIKDFYEHKQNALYDTIRTAERGEIDDIAQAILAINDNLKQIEMREKEIEKSIKEKREGVNNDSDTIA